MTTTIELRDQTGLQPKIATAWVTGWINGGSSTAFGVLQSDGTFGDAGASTAPFYAVSSVASVYLSVPTNGNDRLLFVVSPTQPDALTVTSHSPIEYTQYPYSNTPGVAAPGPFDVFEFGMDAQYDLSAVSGFGLNLSFSLTLGGVQQQFGVDPSLTRSAIGTAFTTFVANEATTFPPAAAFAELLYDGPIDVTGAPTPPSVDSQFFGVCDPNDMLASLTGNYANSTTDPLATYWDSTLASFFAADQYLSINLSANIPHPDIYSGKSSKTTHPTTGEETTAYELTGKQGTFTYYPPPAGLHGAQYVFQQAFGAMTPAGNAGDAGLLQDCIWEAICRGVATSGTSTTAITNGESTAKWNDDANWYPAGSASHIYAKFLHYSDIDGTDSRVSGKPPIFYDNAVYGFSMDENPLGPYSGPNVPSKTVQNVPDGSTVTVNVGPWDIVAD